MHENRRNFNFNRLNKWLRVLPLLFSVILFSSCSGMKTASETEDIDGQAPVIDSDVISDDEIINDDEDIDIGVDSDEEVVQWNLNAKVCIVLGPGMARGFAHVGVLEALSDAKVPIHCIVGVEMGAIVGVLYANSMDTNTLQWQLFKLKRRLYLDYPLFSLKEKRASGIKVHKFLMSYLGNKKLSELRMPVHVSVTNVSSGVSEMLKDIDAADAVSASVAISRVFDNWKLSKNSYSSGLISSPLPIQEARRMGATHVIVVDLLKDPFTAARRFPE